MTYTTPSDSAVVIGTGVGSRTGAVDAKLTGTGGGVAIRVVFPNGCNSLGGAVAAGVDGKAVGSLDGNHDGDALGDPVGGIVLGAAVINDG
jgi:hypothetical protein